MVAGDKRSFAMVKIAAHRLAGEKRKGWAVVNVVAEMCEALVREDEMTRDEIDSLCTPSLSIAPLTASSSSWLLVIT